ncbi:CMGC/DYRK/DYRK2 protein kinase [Ephemerocybe angulata]|uniref:dual-specificity kinase n=1 Tax=Ephemerocybe angulata TaxID=980116 RepID=A0A8H6MD65_9AGAR|nr:CMGC/DYRK/DYRK2 protein kinase [Tulosesus angulatus]
MSAPPSPHTGHSTLHTSARDRPAHLHLDPDDEPLPVDDGEAQRYQDSHAPQDIIAPVQAQVNISVSLAEGGPSQSNEDEPPRSASVSSSLDPYYFGIGSPSDSPTHSALHTSHHLSVTPDHPFLHEPPQTPARNPASIDRRGLVGVGELTTPRWSKADTPYYEVSVDEVESYQAHVRDDDDDEGGRDAPDSPWTIEAIDGEGSDREDQSIALEPPPRPLRTRKSIADESGGEEILYPRNTAPSASDFLSSASEDQAKSPRVLPPSDSAINTPPSAFSASTRRARKRTSDEFELDHAGTLVSKRVPTSETKAKGRDDLKSSTRKHRSLNMSTSSSTSPRETRTREKRRESVGLGIISPSSASAKGSDRHHSRQSSGGSAGLQVESPANRRVHTDYSHLPPSPSSSSIQHILRQTAHASPASNRKEPSGNVAHSLLRGTQEGWSGLDDEATAEALRKLDGLGGKSARSRASVASLGRNSNSSRPTTPSGKSQQQWEGMSASDSGKSRRGSLYVRDKDPGANVSTLPSDTSMRDADTSILSSDDPGVYSDKTPKKQTRLSFTPKRGSTSSTTYASTPTTSSRDSATTNATSISAASGRHSSSKNRRNSAGSDISSVHSSDATHLKDRAAHLAANGDVSEDAAVPPVPPLPKDLSSYRSPPSTSASHVFPTIPSVDDPEPSSSHDVTFDNKLSLEVPSIRSPPSSHAPSHAHTESVATQSTVQSAVEPPPPVVLKTPSKKWSFSSALNLKLSIKSLLDSLSVPVLSASVTNLRKSSSKDKTNSASSTNPPWSPQPDAMTSANSLASISSIGSVRNQSSKTPDKLSYSDTGSSTTTSHLSANPSGALSPAASVKRGQSKRLTPSSIPFFRRSSSQSMQPPSSSGGSGTAPSPPLPPPPHRSSKGNVTPNNDHSEAAKELQRAKDAARESEKEKARSDKEEKKAAKKDDKDRSESRISVLMGRKRGKLKSGSSHAGATPSVSSRTSTSSSRLTSHTVSSMQKQSDSSLRSRHQLPTIAGSPSVGTNGTNSAQTLKDHGPSVLMNSGVGASEGDPHEDPPHFDRRTSMNTAAPGSSNPSPISSTNEFGILASDDGATPKVSGSTARQLRGSPQSVSRPPRQSTGGSTVTGNAIPRKSTRDSCWVYGFAEGVDELGQLAVDPSIRGRSRAMGSPSSSRQSVSTPSPVPSSVDEDELLGDEEMMQYIRRQQAKKLAAGATQEELDELLKFPEPIPPRTPTTPAALLKSPQAQSLSEYERKEILDYPSIYCIGSQSWKKRASPDNPANNFGYDDERGDYQIVMGDHLAYRYEVVGNLGKGSFGQVLNCRDHCTGESVAVKIIRNKKRFHHQALVEIKILDNLRKWDADEKHHVAKMIEHFYFRNHLCIAMELLSINLYELIKANGFVGFTTGLIRRFTSQMLMSLSLMRHHRIVHCDLKPENVLLRHPAKSAIKVIDFGSSCFEHEKIYTYIQSRFYRSPEVILGMNYHMAIDMWSLGCILAELYTGFPIFPGENEQEQLSCIMEVLGVPDKEFVNRSSRKKLFFDTNGVPRTVVNSKGRRRRPGSKTLAQVLRCQDEEFIDFIAKCLIWEPERRMKPQAAMRHPFITAGKRKAQVSSKTSSLSSSLAGSRSKNVTETPKKSMIGAPAPLAARTPRTATNGVTGTPSSTAAGSISSSRSYRSYQSQTLGALGTGRGTNGYSVSSSKL